MVESLKFRPKVMKSKWKGCEVAAGWKFNSSGEA